MRILIILALSFLVACNKGLESEEKTKPMNTIAASTTTDLQNGRFKYTYDNNFGPERNPLKGWVSGYGDNDEETTVGMQYISWKEFEPSDGKFDYNRLEAIVNQAGSKGRHLVLRIYCDWANYSSGSECPDWLNGAPHSVTRFTGGNDDWVWDPTYRAYTHPKITDYNANNFKSQAKQAINALVQYFQNDPRVFAFEFGVIGYFGEWHTAGGPKNLNLQISDDTKRQIIAGYVDALNQYPYSVAKPRLMGRYPWDPILKNASAGYYNDYFWPGSVHSDEFDETVSRYGFWNKGPIGGEMPPDLEKERHNLVKPLFDWGGKVENAIKKGHYTWMKSGVMRGVAREYCKPQYDRFAQYMGYNFQIEEAELPRSITINSSGDLNVKIKNIGLAPMYQNWVVQYGLLDFNNNAKKFQSVSNPAISDLTQGIEKPFISKMKFDVGRGWYKIGIRIIQWNADLEKTELWKLDPRNVTVGFANDIEFTTPKWGPKKEILGGWNILGNVEVK